jgi:hypothetical protein
LQNALKKAGGAQRQEDDFYIDSVALNLHGFYSGVERIFFLIATTVDGTAPEGNNWHQILLDRMASEHPPHRPAVISEETRAALDEYRAFRHIVRNIYAFHFDAAKIQTIVERLPATFAKMRDEVLSFADFLVLHRD